MKKFLILMLSILLGLSALTGCESTLAPLFEKDVAEVPELSIEEFFSEEQGFHFPTAEWGINFADFQAKNDYPVSELLTYGDDENKLYSLDGMKRKVLGRVNDEASAAFNKEDICREVSVAFSMKTENPTISQDDFWKEYLPALTEKFGEPEKSEENGDLGDNDVKRTETYIWKYTTPDGKETELHFSAMYLSYAGEPSYIAIGFLWKNTINEEAK